MNYRYDPILCMNIPVKAQDKGIDNLMQKLSDAYRSNSTMQKKIENELDRIGVYSIGDLTESQARTICKKLNIRDAAVKDENTFAKMKREVAKAHKIPESQVETNIMGFVTEYTSNKTGELLGKYNSKTGKLIVNSLDTAPMKDNDPLADPDECPEGMTCDAKLDKAIKACDALQFKPNVKYWSDQHHSYFLFKGFNNATNKYIFEDFGDKQFSFNEEEAKKLKAKG